MRYTFIALLSVVLASVVSADALAQRMPERRLVRKGNRQYERGDYDSSIDNYSRALQHDPQSFEAKFNTANVQFRKAFVDSLQMDAICTPPPTTTTSPWPMSATFWSSPKAAPSTPLPRCTITLPRKWQMPWRRLQIWWQIFGAMHPFPLAVQKYKNILYICLQFNEICHEYTFLPAMPGL